jgi:hypothetical protein
LIFEKAEERRTAWIIRENQKIYEVKPAGKKMGWSHVSVFPRSQEKLRVKIIPNYDLNSNLRGVEPCSELSKYLITDAWHLFCYFSLIAIAVAEVPIPTLSVALAFAPILCIFLL